jgi:hypothetical protein
LIGSWNTVIFDVMRGKKISSGANHFLYPTTTREKEFHFNHIMLNMLLNIRSIENIELRNVPSISPRRVTLRLDSFLLPSGKQKQKLAWVIMNQRYGL